MTLTNHTIMFHITPYNIIEIFFDDIVWGVYFWTVC